MDKRVREISRFFVAPRREFAPAVWRVSRTFLSRNTSTSVHRPRVFDHLHFQFTSTSQREIRRWQPCVFLIPGPFGECRIFCIGAHTVGIWGKNQKQFSAEASFVRGLQKEGGSEKRSEKLLSTYSDLGERAWNNLLVITRDPQHVSIRVIYNCRRRSLLSLTLVLSFPP